MASSSYGISFTGRSAPRRSSLELRPHPRQAARDARGDRARRQGERLADRPVALVAREEAVEDLLAVLRQAGGRPPGPPRLLDLLQPVVERGGGHRLRQRLGRPGGAQAVDAQAAGELAEPRPDGGVVAQAVEALVGAGEYVLEDVLGVRVAQAVGAGGDRVDVAGEALDQQSPGRLVTGAASPDEVGVAGLHEPAP